MNQGIPVSPISANTHEGYLSEESKRKFTITAGILGAAFFFMQMFVPFLVMMLFMPTFYRTSAKLTRYSLKRAAEHDGHLFFFAEEYGRNVKKGRYKLMSLDLTNIPEAESAEDKKSIKRLFRFVHEKAIDPEEIVEIDATSPWLLAGGKNLLIISQSRMWELKAGQLAEIASYVSLGSISRPFYYSGSPAVIEGRHSSEAYLGRL